MPLDPLFIVLAVLSGGAVGFVLGLIGGGGSVLAVPLLLYVVGVDGPHAAIGTGAVAVAANAAISLTAHMRAGTVKWPCAMVFAGAGILGAFGGSSLGKAIDGQALLAAFGGAMILIGIITALPRKTPDNPDVRLTRDSASELLPRLVPFGLGAGAAAGFFGIGGGFLIAPGLMAATRMPMRMAVGTSLVAVTVFGATTAANYALSDLVDWRAAGLFVVGGIAGGFLGQRASAHLARKANALTLVFSGLVVAVGVYVIAQGIGVL